MYKEDKKKKKRKKKQKNIHAFRLSNFSGQGSLFFLVVWLWHHEAANLGLQAVKVSSAIVLLLLLLLLVLMMTEAKEGLLLLLVHLHQIAQHLSLVLMGQMVACLAKQQLGDINQIAHGALDADLLLGLDPKVDLAGLLVIVACTVVSHAHQLLVLSCVSVGRPLKEVIHALLCITVERNEARVLVQYGQQGLRRRHVDNGARDDLHHKEGVALLLLLHVLGVHFACTTAVHIATQKGHTDGSFTCVLLQSLDKVLSLHFVVASGPIYDIQHGQF